MCSDAKSVHAAVASLVRDEGISALGSAASVQSAVRHLCDHPEASVLYRFSTDQMLGAFVEAAEARSDELLSEATLEAGASLADCAGVSHLDARLAASEIALGVSEALGMRWEVGARLGTRSDHGTAEDDAESVPEQGEVSTLGPSVKFLMCTYLFIRFVMAPLGALAGSKPPAKIPGAGAFLLAALLTFGFGRLLIAIFRGQYDSLVGTARKLIEVAIIALPLAMGLLAWWCSVQAGL